jgi:hypothetical protein
MGLAVAWHYWNLGLTLSHYDAKAHLVVARRVIDSLTPGWQQVGAVWLPLPHLLNLLPVQVDAFYRTGASAVAFSIASFAVACGAAARIVIVTTGSQVAAAIAVAMMALNPNLLYLQATPMTEPLLLGLTLAGLASLLAWVRTGGSASARNAGVLLALACLTRYESWPVTAAAISLAAFVIWRQGARPGAALQRAARVAAYPTLAIAWFMVHSRITIGRWFMDNSFFIADNPASGHPLTSAIQVCWGVHRLSGYASTIAATLAIAGLVAIVLLSRSRAPVILALAPLAALALPFYAFLEGHPFRIRYMVPGVAAAAIATGVALGLLRPAIRNWAAAVLLACLAVFDLRPLDPSAPMVLEAQWDTEHRLGRQQVTEHLTRSYKGDKILASMGSLAHYMQETSAQGFTLRDYVHEGNGDLWRGALANPRAFVGWILVEERAEGGDQLAARGRQDPSFFDGFTRVAEGGGGARVKREPHTGGALGGGAGFNRRPAARSVQNFR